MIFPWNTFCSLFLFFSASLRWTRNALCLCVSHFSSAPIHCSIECRPNVSQIIQILSFIHRFSSSQLKNTYTRTFWLAAVRDFFPWACKGIHGLHTIYRSGENLQLMYSSYYITARSPAADVTKLSRRHTQAIKFIHHLCGTIDGKKYIVYSAASASSTPHKQFEKHKQRNKVNDNNNNNKKQRPVQPMAASLLARIQKANINIFTKIFVFLVMRLPTSPSSSLMSICAR